MSLRPLQLAPDQGMAPADRPTELRQHCEEEAKEIVQQTNSLRDDQQCVSNPRLKHLISGLTALLLQIKVSVRYTHNSLTVLLKLFVCLIMYLFVLQCLAEGGDLNSFEFKSLMDSLNDIKSSIEPSNLR